MTVGGYPGIAKTPITPDSIIVCGDSISRNAFGRSQPGETVFPSIPYRNKIKTAYPPNYPKVFNMSMGGWKARNGAPVLEQILADNPIPDTVFLPFGTNDAGASDPDYQSLMEEMIGWVLDAGKTPMIPLIPWSTTGVNIPAYNTIIQNNLWTISGVRHGPDLYTYFQAHPDQLQGDGTHPTTAGFDALIDLWVAAMAWRYP